MVDCVAVWRNLRCDIAVAEVGEVDYLPVLEDADGEACVSGYLADLRDSLRRLL